MTPALIAFDGDDTLWHHDNYFREAIEKFHFLVNEWGDYPDARSQLDDQHIKDLSLWGYGVKGLILTMMQLALTMTNGRLDGTQMQQILDIGRSLYLHPVQLLDHVLPTVTALHQRFQLMLITKGDLVAQEMKISQSGLAGFFDVIEIVSEKDTETYRKIFKRARVDPKDVIMIGNTLRSDVLPSIRAGAQAVHIPYQSSWHHEVAEVAESDKNSFITLSDMRDLPKILDSLVASPDARLRDIVAMA